MSFAISRGNHIIDCNGKVINSTIENTSIDMNGGVITSHGAPVDPGDVVNKTYVDSLAAGIPLIDITLSSTNYTSALPLVLQGDIYISVKSLVSGGPSGTFQLSKAHPSRGTSYTRTTSSSGLTSNERLEIKWDPNAGIEVRKNGINYDGVYRIKYILNE